MREMWRAGRKRPARGYLAVLSGNGGPAGSLATGADMTWLPAVTRLLLSLRYLPLTALSLTDRLATRPEGRIDPGNVC